MTWAHQNLKSRSTLIALGRSKSDLAKVPAAILPDALPSTVRDHLWLAISFPFLPLEAFATVGVALWTTTLALAAGFLVISTSAFSVNAEMGLLVAVVVVLALVVDFLLLPTLLHVDSRGLCAGTGANRVDLYLRGIGSLLSGESQPYREKTSPINGR